MEKGNREEKVKIMVVDEEEMKKKKRVRLAQERRRMINIEGLKDLPTKGGERDNQAKQKKKRDHFGKRFFTGQNIKQT